jgi:aryl-alcohol dehydrogenase-like predicted oxidoreductase
MSLRRLDVERIDLYQLHRVDPDTPMEDSLGELKALQDEGKIRHIGVSEVDVDTLKQMRDVVEVVSVQNMYNLTDRQHEDVLDYCESEGLGFIPWFPLATGKLARDGGPLDEAAKEHDSSPSQLALAWLLRRSPVMLPIPGTSSVEHLEDNCAAAAIELSDEEFETIGKATG